MKKFKIEFYPDGFDEKGNAKGPRAMVLDFYKPNYKRFKEMTKREKNSCAGEIDRFIDRLLAIKEEMLNPTKP